MPIRREQWVLAHPEAGEYCRSHQDDSDDPVVGSSLEDLMAQVAEVCDYGDSEDLATEFVDGVLVGFVPIRQVVINHPATVDELAKFHHLVGRNNREDGSEG